MIGILKTTYHSIKPYSTKDGSEVRELMHPNQHGNLNQSLAEATVPEGGTTFFHRHIVSEEIYHIKEGKGIMTLGDEIFEVTAGDTICILPGTPHKIFNTGPTPLRILCCCAPAYSHEDTQLIT
ncbi:MAG: cupin domain-containing protein [Desulfobacteraceae bacterium]|nr:MAG: cupin domain-containing protein [Desulfobacteraceae bacterium]